MQRQMEGCHGSNSNSIASSSSSKVKRAERHGGPAAETFGTILTGEDWYEGAVGKKLRIHKGDKNVEYSICRIPALGDNWMTLHAFPVSDGPTASGAKACGADLDRSSHAVGSGMMMANMMSRSSTSSSGTTSRTTSTCTSSSNNSTTTTTSSSSSANGNAVVNSNIESMKNDAGCRDPLAHLTLPISIQKDLVKNLAPPAATSSRREVEAYNAAMESAPVRLRDSSETDRHAERNLVSYNPREIDQYFIVIEGNSKDTLEVLGLSKWHSFVREPCSAETRQKLITEEDAELHRRSTARKEELLNAKVQHMIKTDSDDEKSGRFVNPQNADNVFGEDLGIHRHKAKQQKLMKQLTAARTGAEIARPGVGADGNSALTLGSLRSSAVTWDYDHDLEMTDDEDDAQHDGQLDGGVDADAEADDAEDEMDNAEMSLTSYGQTLKTLLKRQEEEDEEDELAQYSDDNDDEESHETSATAATTGDTAASTASASPHPASFFFPPPSSAAVEPTGHLPGDSSTSASSSLHQPAVAAAASVEHKAEGSATESTVDEASSSLVCGVVTTESKEKQWESRVIRKLQQHGGRMNIRDFMDAFKLKTKDSEFRLLQQIVRKLCSAQSEKDVDGNQNKFIQLKPDYRR